MLKKVGELLLKHVLWPLFRVIVTLIVDKLIDYIIEKIKALYDKWMKEDMEKANSSGEKEKIKKKYELRKQDLDNLKHEIQNDLPNIVNQVIDSASAEGNKLLEEVSNKQPKQLPVK